MKKFERENKFFKDKIDREITSPHLSKLFKFNRIRKLMFDNTKQDLK